MKYEIDASGNFIRIYINGVLHLMFKQDEFLGLESWIASTNLFYLEIYLRGLTIKCEYDSIEKWKSIIALIEKTL